MATENNTIRINPTKPSTLEFDVMISGLDTIVPIVRFVIQKANEEVDWVVKCSKLEGTKWQASFPAFKNFKVNSCEFCVEVIVDEYFFKPAEGMIEFINTPDISFNSKTRSNKPSVTTSFTVKQSDEMVKPLKNKKVVIETSGEVTGMYAPTNGLLSPEENPEYDESNVKIPHTEKDDELVNKARLWKITDKEPTPGTGASYPEEDIDDDLTDTDIDPTKVVEAILLTKHTLPISQGSLFKRDADGKAIVPGLESVSQKQARIIKEQKIKDILKQ